MKKSKKIAAILLSTLCMAVSLFPITSNAGFSTTVIDNGSFEKDINNTIWNNPKKDVISKDNKLVFPAESTEATRLISKSAINQNELADKMFHAEYTMKVAKLPKGKEFVLACGMSGIESSIGGKGNIEVALTNDNGIKAEVRVYETAKEATVLQKATAVGTSQGGTMKVALTLTKEQKYTVVINNKTIFDDKIPMTGKGRIGFLQTGECHIEISDLNIETYSYDTPENANVKEKFDNKTFDTSLLTSFMTHSYGYFPCSISVEKYNDEDVLLFRNAGLGYIGTRYQYSNFEMTFDVPYIQRTDVYAKDNTIEVPKSQWFGITFGDEYMDSTTYDYDFSSPEMIYFNEFSQVLSLKMKEGVLAELSSSDHAFFAADEKRGFSVKLSVIDAHVEVGIKWMDEDNFKTVASFDTPDKKTPTGYIHIWGSEPTNFAIDNLVITNKDKDAKLITTEYKPGTIEVPEDYVYAPTEMVYNENAQEDKGFNWYLIIPCAAAVAVLFVGISYIIVLARRRKEREDEE